MKLLIIGGGIFVGRAVVAAAQARGHEVSVFNRGQTSAAPPGVEAIIGDRNGDLSALKGRSWDAVVDTSGYLPRQVQSLLSVIGGGISHYTFISTISVYRSFAARGLTEDSPLAPPPEPSVETVTPQTYGPLKAACEGVARSFPHSLIIRPGIIVGPWDPTGRFTYWVRRASRGGDILAPGSPESPLQLIDSRDLATWAVSMVERRATGIFNAVGDPSLTWGAMLETALTAAGLPGRPVWVGDDFLIAQKADDWGQLPLMIPAAKTELAGMFRVDGGAALQARLRLRPLADTVIDLLAWIKDPAATKAKQPGLAADKETSLLAAWANPQSP